jgi:ribosome-associated protein
MRQHGRGPAVEAGGLATEERLEIAENALLDRRAVSPVVLDMRELTVITDYFLICHGTSNVHIRALADAVVEAMKEVGVRAYGVEGYQQGQWVLLDYGDIVVHVMAVDEREFYNLERLWSDAPRRELTEAGNL